EIAVIPLCRIRRPRAFQATGDGVVANAGVMPALPAQALLRDIRTLRLRADLRGIARAMALAEGVATRRQRNRLLVIHPHAGEGLADVTAGADRVRLTARAFRIDVDKAHLDRRQ